MTVNRVVRLMAVSVALVLSLVGSAHALDVKFQPVADGVYAYIGDTGPRSLENEGLNANIGLVVTPAGAVLIDSGATYRSARQIHDAVRKVTAVPGQVGHQHRRAGPSLAGQWLFQGTGRRNHRARGCHGPTCRRAVATTWPALKSTLHDRADGTVPTLPTRYISEGSSRLDLGGVVFQLEHRNGAHTPGDMMVWLPQKNVLFTGDVVYVNRLLGVIPVSNTRNWLATFAVIEALDPKVIVPGHGDVTDLATARADTQAYLVALRAHMKKAVEDGVDMSAAVKSFDAEALAAPAATRASSCRATRAAPTSNSNASDARPNAPFPSSLNFPGDIAWTSRYSAPAARTAAPPSH